MRNGDNSNTRDHQRVSLFTLPVEGGGSLNKGTCKRLVSIVRSICVLWPLVILDSILPVCTEKNSNLLYASFEKNTFLPILMAKTFYLKT